MVAAAGAQPAPREWTTAELAQRVLPSVVAIETPKGFGSGFFVRPDLVVTCFHVVRGESEIQLKSARWTGRAVAVVAWSETHDLAVLRVTPADAGRGLSLDPGPYVVGTKVVVVSSPLGFEDTVSEGIVSAYRSLPQDRLQFTAPISPGSSGGPVLNAKGEVAGMVASFEARLRRGITIGQNLNFAVPASVIAMAMAAPNEISLEAFAAQTVPAEEKEWRNIEARLGGLDGELREELGENVGKKFGLAIRKAVADRDSEKVKQLRERANELKGFRSNLIDRATRLQQLGGSGPQIAAALVSAWEDWALNPTEEASARLSAVSDRGVVFVREATGAATLEATHDGGPPSLPSRFAGFAFMSSSSDLHEYCWGDRREAGAGLTSLSCPRVPVRPPFTAGDATLYFLDGALVSVRLEVSSYKDAVKAIADKYGEPTPGFYVKGGWQEAKKPSYGPNTCFNWTLKGGRIRVGRLQGKLFVTFIRSERDEAIESSY
jgi:hypothetical protein